MVQHIAIAAGIIVGLIVVVWLMRRAGVFRSQHPERDVRLLASPERCDPAEMAGLTFRVPRQWGKRRLEAGKWMLLPGSPITDTRIVIQTLGTVAGHTYGPANLREYGAGLVAKRGWTVRSAAPRRVSHAIANDMVVERPDEDGIHRVVDFYFDRVEYVVNLRTDTEQELAEYAPAFEAFLDAFTLRSRNPGFSTVRDPDRYVFLSWTARYEREALVMLALRKALAEAGIGYFDFTEHQVDDTTDLGAEITANLEKAVQETACSLELRARGLEAHEWVMHERELLAQAGKPRLLLCLDEEYLEPDEGDADTLARLDFTCPAAGAEDEAIAYYKSEAFAARCELLAHALRLCLQTGQWYHLAPFAK